MKNLNFILLVFFILFPISVLSQDKIEIKDFGFSMNSPKDWIAFNKNGIIPNIKSYDFNKDQIDAFSKQVTNSIEFITLSKYDPTKYFGIIPTINIRVDKNPTKNIIELQKAIDLSVSTNKVGLLNLNYIEKSNIVTINGKQIIRLIIGYTLKNNGVEYKIKSYKIVIPVGKFYINLNFIEEEKKEDNSKLFEELINSIKAE